jgi:hypothetical protein
VSSDPGHRPQSTRVHNISAQVARSSIVPAGRVFSLQATRLVSSTRRPAVSSEATTPRSPGRRQPGLEAVAAVLHGQAGPARATRYIPITHNERHPIGLLSLCMQQQAFVRFGSRMGQGVEVPHSSTTRAVTMGSTGTTRRPYSARRRTSRRRSTPRSYSG